MALTGPHMPQNWIQLRIFGTSYIGASEAAKQQQGDPVGCHSPSHEAFRMLWGAYMHVEAINITELIGFKFWTLDFLCDYAAHNVLIILFFS